MYINIRTKSVLSTLGKNDAIATQLRGETTNFYGTKNEINVAISTRSGFTTLLNETTAHSDAVKVIFLLARYCDDVARISRRVRNKSFRGTIIVR